MFIQSSNEKYNWQDYTLILPTVSVGNVGQLAADLIISTLNMERVGYVLHPCLLPVFGNDPYAVDDSTSHKVTTTCEVFESQAAKVIVLQERAPIIKGRKKEYADWLSGWIQENQFYQVVVLTSTFSQERLDHQISGSPFRILLSPKMEERAGEDFKTLMNWQKLEPRPSISGLSVQTGAEENKLLYMPGSGIAKLLYENCLDLPVLVLLMFVSEGDNAYDALTMVGQLNRWLNLLVSTNVQDKQQKQNVAINFADWKIPISWRLIFGSMYDQKLFQ